MKHIRLLAELEIITFTLKDRVEREKKKRERQRQRQKQIQKEIEKH